MSNLLNIKDENGNWIPIPIATNGIASIVQNSDYTLTITLEDGTVYTTTSIRGEQGAQGIKGDKGDSFTYSDFTPEQLTSLKGEKGDKGDAFTYSDFTPEQLASLKGEKGDRGIQGIQGEKGDSFTYADFTPEQLASLKGAKGNKGDKGDKGDTGDNYILTQADKQEIAGLVDTPVDDVQINGTSIVSNEVAEIPIASSNDFGVVKVRQYTDGLFIASDDNFLRVQRASSSQIKAGVEGSRPLAPYCQHEATFYGLAKAAGYDEKNSTLPLGEYTEEAKIAIQKMLGLYRGWELIADVTIEEDSVQVDIVTDGNGQPFELTEMFARVWLQPSTTGTNDYVAAINLVIFDAGTTGTASAPTKKYMANGASTFMEYVSKLMCGINYSLGSAGTGPNNTASIEKLSGTYTNIKSYRGFRLRQYSSTSTLIPTGTNIKLYGIRI